MDTTRIDTKKNNQLGVSVKRELIISLRVKKRKTEFTLTKQLLNFPFNMI